MVALSKRKASWTKTVVTQANPHSTKILTYILQKSPDTVHNLYILLKIAGKPGWWLILFFIPLVNLVMSILLSIDVAKAFGKGVGFGLGLTFLGFIFYPILGFGEAQYQGNAQTR